MPMRNPSKQNISVPENELVHSVSLFLAEQGYRVRAEVPSLGQSADLVATRGRWVSFIEVKVRDWRSAINQCKAHKLVGDFICIALGTKNISEAVKQATANEGIGLIHVLADGTCSWIVKPVLNARVWQPQRRRFSQNLQAVAYVR